jgi:hypothetical protein
MATLTLGTTMPRASWPETEKGRVMRWILIAALLLMLPVLVLLPEYPTAVVCDRAQPSVEVKVESTRRQGRIEQSKFGGCVLYWHRSRGGFAD